EVAAGSNTITTLASFDKINTGGQPPPLGGGIEDSNGNLYGTTSSGGSRNVGTVFELAAGSNTITALATINNTNAESPGSALTFDNNGDLFGTTVVGGAANDGTVFKVHLPRVRLWTGGGLNNLWSNAANWDHLPLPGDTLVFNGTPQTTVNDFAAGTDFGGIQIASPTDSAHTWQLNGNQIVLDAT